MPCWDAVRCPACREPLVPSGGAAACRSGHSFDVARSGYVNLLTGGGARRVGDTKAMVAARAAFLAGGHFTPLATAIAELVRREPGPVVDVGCGTGHYLAALGTGGCRYGIDLSKDAARVAARAVPEALVLVADVESGLPLADGCAGVVLSVFAPRPAAELLRITRPGGLLAVAFATERHFAGPRAALGLLTVAEGKREQLVSRFRGGAGIESARLVEYDVELAEPDVRAWIAMGPNARHARPAVDLTATTATVSVELLALRRH